jgi:hypothetical protein
MYSTNAAQVVCHLSLVGTDDEQWVDRNAERMTNDELPSKPTEVSK